MSDYKHTRVGRQSNGTNLSGINIDELFNDFLNSSVLQNAIASRNSTPRVRRSDNRTTGSNQGRNFPRNISAPVLQNAGEGHAVRSASNRGRRGRRGNRKGLNHRHNSDSNVRHDQSIPAQFHGHSTNKEGNRNQRTLHGQRTRQGQSLEPSGGNPEQLNEKIMGYKFLESIKQKSANDAVFILINRIDGLTNTCSKNDFRKKPDMLVLLLEIFGKICESNKLPRNIPRILEVIRDVGFLSEVGIYLLDKSRDTSVTSADLSKAIVDTLHIIKSMLIYMPSSAYKECGSAHDTINIVIQRSTLRASLNIPNELLEDVRDTITQFDKEKLQPTKTKPRSKREDIFDDLHRQEPPDDYRTIPVIPDLKDLNDQRAFIRPNLINRAYKNETHYLDVQYRLLREDFVRPLRNGIQEVSRNLNSNEPIKRYNNNVKIYHDVELISPIFGPKGLLYKIQFNVEHLKNVRWENSKRFLHGNLLCLSKDGFKDNTIFAFVSERSADELTLGKLSITLVSPPNQDGLKSKLDANVIYTMVESDAFFEAYKHVLTCLSNMQHIPLSRYIVFCKKKMKYPAYLTGTVDLRCVAPKCAFAGTCVPGCGVWPNPSDFNLDASQAEAFKLALTHELAVIQGPPGTGKTHVGLKIMEALLHNKQQDTGPIIVVCYTNHALDQFVEGIARFWNDNNPGKIVRVGGRCKSEELKRFTLGEIKMEQRQSRSKDGAERRKAVWNLKREIKDMANDSAKDEIQIDALSQAIPKLQFLEEFIPGTLYAQFNQCMSGNCDPILLWLGVKEEIERGCNETGKPVSDLRMLDTFDGIDEEADLIQSRRILDTDYVDQQQNLNKKNLATLAANMIAMSFKDFFSELGKVDKDGFQMDRSTHKKLVSELRKETFMEEKEESRIKDIWALSFKEKWKLLRLWTERFKTTFGQKITSSSSRYESMCESLIELRMQEDEEIIKQADVVALTTTGAARMNEVINKLNSKIVVVEEAAECLEAHIISSMPKTTEHLILIGDHQQLKPSPTVYELAVQYKLDTSLFERMIGVIPYKTLKQQHRMRKEIADLLRPHIYKNLIDADNVKVYEEISGVLKSVYFVSHGYMEDEVEDSKSKRNTHEASFLVGLCNYLLQQGYKASQITILTAYSGQLLVIKNILKQKIRQHVYATAVDNYQGEENDIILLSLVRSNEEGRIGFLGVENRVCVALSRAKKGLYCIGNMELLRKNNGLWENIIQTVKAKECYGDSLPLQCKTHPETRTLVKNGEDFMKLSPEGGCQEDCTFRLECGHSCPRKCHPDSHDGYRCRKECGKECKNKLHKCRKLCYNDCGDCQKSVERELRCGHKQISKCYMSPDSIECASQCEKFLTCGHRCQMNCGDLSCTTECRNFIQRTFSCGHVGNIYCFEKDLPKACKKKCDVVLKCKHVCSGNCTLCFKGCLHKSCGIACDRTLVCGHACASKCSIDCPPCEKPCETMCEHSKCNNLCGEPCVLCKEPCGWECPHYECTMLCSEPCNRPRCDQPCMKVLKCEHQCIGICGEDCPSLCGICDAKELKKMLSTSKLTQKLNENSRYMQLQCGHIFNSESLDKWMEITDKTHIYFKVCPDCGNYVRKSKRYGNQVNSAIRKLNTVKARVVGSMTKRQIEYSKLEAHLKSSQVAFSGYFNDEHKILVCSIKELKANKLPNEKISTLTTQINMLATLANILQHEGKISLYLETENRRKIKDWRKVIFEVAKWVMKSRVGFSEEDKHSFDCMSKKHKATLQLFEVYLALEKQPGTTGRTLAASIEKLLLETSTRYEGSNKELIEAKLLKLRKHLSIEDKMFATKEESKTSTKQFNLASWITCSCGHVYRGHSKSYCPVCQCLNSKSDPSQVLKEKAEKTSQADEMPAYNPMNLDSKYWSEASTDRKFRMEVLDHDTNDFKVVSEYFLDNLPGVQLLKIERVENTELYIHYDIKKKLQKLEEKTLFHGTNPETSHHICRKGFDKGYMGKNGVAYGNGNYFATSAQYSHNFSSKAVAGGEKKMIIAKVLVGKFAKGKKGIIEPPAGCNSVVDNEKNPTMYIVFRDADSYPQFVVTYK